MRKHVSSLLTSCNQTLFARADTPCAWFKQRRVARNLHVGRHREAQIRRSGLVRIYQRRGSREAGGVSAQEQARGVLRPRNTSIQLDVRRRRQSTLCVDEN